MWQQARPVQNPCTVPKAGPAVQECPKAVHHKRTCQLRRHNLCSAAAEVVANSQRLTAMGAIQPLEEPCKLVWVAFAGWGTQGALHAPEVIDHWRQLAARAAVAATGARLQECAKGKAKGRAGVCSLREARDSYVASLD